VENGCLWREEAGAWDSLKTQRIRWRSNLNVAPTPQVRGRQMLAFTGCGKTPPSCHSDPAVAGEESRSEHFQRNARFLVVPQGGTPRNDRPDGFFRSL
jgi:hypothetical protein